ncbi:MAG: acetate kinase [Bacilli bacterium]|nr:acetate kinase [Bacilli bacterium]
MLQSVNDIAAVGHRVVSGGEAFSDAVIVTAEVKREIKQLFDLAPLYNPAHMMGIQTVIPTNEELTIARQTYRCLNKRMRCKVEKTR